MKPVIVLPKSFSLDIQKLTMPIYEEVIRDYVNRFSQRNGVLWIGQLGSLTAPGISDIDLMLVCEDEYCVDVAQASNKFITQSPLHRYLFIHQVFVVPYNGVKTVFYFHPLDNLRTLWGDSSILDKCEQPNDVIRLFRAVHWASSSWSKTLHFCQQDAVSLRSILVRTKGLATTADRNYLLIGNKASVGVAAQSVEQERQQILSADPGEQSELAKTSFWEAIQILAKSDRDLRAWINQEGLYTGYGKRKKIWLSAEHAIVFEDSLDFDQENFHQHALGMHITHLPYYYYVFGFLIAQPYMSLEPSLSRLWDMRVAAHIDNMNLKRATENWYEAFCENVNDFRRAGMPPFALDVYPFNVHMVDPVILRIIKQATPVKFRQWLRERL